jgi:hypothetical protein
VYLALPSVASDEPNINKSRQKNARVSDPVGCNLDVFVVHSAQVSVRPVSRGEQKKADQVPCCGLPALADKLLCLRVVG